MQTIQADIHWTNAAAEWWNLHSYGFDAERAAELMDKARAVAAEDGRAVMGRNDLEAARERLAP